MVVIRSTWDYWNDVPGFLEALAVINRLTRLANPLSLVHWNLAKSYLRDLEGRGVGVVPTLWLEELRTGELEQLPRFTAVDGDVDQIAGRLGDRIFFRELVE